MPLRSAGPSRSGPSPTVSSPPSIAQLTFLFTDIEASTRAWEQHPDGMPAALARHDRLLHQAVDAAGGRVFKHTGDGMLAVFGTAPSALAAALAAQAALQRTDWKETGPLRVRMALHSGVAERRGDDYFGPALNRAARLLDTAHGGQLVTSLLTAELLRDELPAVVNLVDLGEHRLADLARPERIFQITHPDLPSQFPPLRSLGTHRHNLPVATSSFIGRERELEAVGDLLRSCRLVTLCGVGGVGKTRLALQVAAGSLDRHADGTFMVELATAVDPSTVVPQVMGTLRLVQNPTDGPEEAIERLCAYVRPRRMLLLLDNCEHLVDAVALLCEALLRRCPDVVVLATSREPLGVGGEVVWRVPPMGLPLPSDAGTESSSDAVSLFHERAQASHSGFEPSPENAGAVARICRRLDGIPLAIELAAARVRVLSPQQIANRLDDRFRFLSSGPRTASARQQTLRATMDWSYDLLSESERLVLQRVAVFAGSFDLAATEAVVADGDGITGGEVLDLLARLVDKSLVGVEDRGPEARYRLLETVRAYAAQRLVVSGSDEMVRFRHRDHFIRLTEQCFWEDPHATGRWMQPLDLEHENVRAALDWSLDRDHAHACLRLVVPLSYHWTMSENLGEASARLERVLALAPSPDTPGRGPVINALGFLHGILGDLDRSISHHAEAVSLATASGDAVGGGLAGWALAARLLHRGDLEQAEQVLTQAYEDCRVAASEAGMGWCEFQWGWIQLARGDRPGSIRRFQRALELARSGQGENLVADALATLAPMAALDGEGEHAQAFAKEAVERARRFGEFTAIFLTLARAAEVGIILGDWPTTVISLREALTRLRDTSGRAFLADSLEMAALVRQAQAASGPAARLLGASQGVRTALGESSDVRAIAGHLKRCEAALECSLGVSGFSAELERGRGLSAAEAVSYALDELAAAPDAPSPARRPPPPVSAGLRRESDRWLVEYRSARFELPDMKGLQYVARLLDRPGSELHVLDLVGAADHGDAGPVLDERAKAEYRRRVGELRDEIEEAEEWNDTERTARAHLELDALTRELAGAIGLGGRDRHAISAAERARVSVRKAITAAIARIAARDPDLGLLLSTTVRTGAYCSYIPDPRLPVTWVL